MRKIVVAALTLLLVSSARSQSPEPQADYLDKPCPDFVFDTLFNHKKRKVSISDMKGKFIILDCWATFCSPCIAGMPKLEAIQKKFSDKLEILMVGLDGYDRIKQFYELREKEGRPVGLPSASTRKAVSHFKTNGVPYYIWIDDKGIVKALTDEVKEEDVVNFITSGSAAWRQRSTVKPLDVPRTIFLLPVIDSIDRGNVLVNSTLTRYTGQIENVTPALSSKYITTKIRVQNRSVGTLYCIAFGNLSTGYIQYNRRMFETAHPEKLEIQKGMDYHQWKLDNAFCYELTVSEDRKEDLLRIMREDLKRYFGYNAYMEYRTQRCLILSVERKVDMSTKSPGSAPYIKLNGITGGVWRNQPFSKLPDAIQHYRQDKILLDETGITGNVDFELKADLLDLESVKKELKKYGLRLDWADRKVEMLVIRDPA